MPFNFYKYEKLDTFNQEKKTNLSPNAYTYESILEKKFYFKIKNMLLNNTFGYVTF